MHSPKFSPTLIRILGISLLIVGMAVALKTGAIQNISRQIRTAVWHPETPWSLEIRQTFLKCGHRLDLQNTYPAESAVRGYLKHHPECRLTGEQANRLVGVETFADFCPSCRNRQFLGILNQEVVVFRGTRKQPGPVKEKTSIRVRLLPAAELADLQKGIPFGDEKEKLQLIEGLNGLVAN